MVVVFAYDGSPFAKRALRYAKRLGPDVQAVVITVSPRLIEGPRTEQSMDPEQNAEHSRRQLDEASRILAEDDVQPTTVTAFGNPAAEIIAAAEEHAADLIVLGQRGRNAIPRFIDGSVMDRVVRHATCYVLVVR
jgi:nucleotide-binding universal stress UspA family protein